MKDELDDKVQEMVDVFEAIGDVVEAIAPAMVDGKVNHGIQRVSWGLLGEWWCVPVNLDEDTAAQVIMDGSQIRLIEGITLDLVKDRLYGGFRCGEHDTHRHVHFSTGQYTYLGTNSPNYGRDETWATIIEANADDGPFIGGGLFCLDAPGRTT